MTKIRRINLRYRDTERVLKICAMNNRLSCSSVTHPEIFVYSLSGEFLRAYGNPRSGKDCSLGSPRICDVDTDGCVLIADRDNNRLQVMSEHGKFRVLELQPEVPKPVGAVIFNGHLYVTSANKDSIYKYALADE